MKKIIVLLTIITLPFIFFQAKAGDKFDQAYVKKFKWGSVIASDKGYPSYSKMNKSQFDFKNKVFYIKGGSGSTLDMRALAKNGKTYKYYIDRAKSKTKKYVKYIKWDVVVVNIWTSHDLKGNKIEKKWPVKFNDIPEWFALEETVMKCRNDCPKEKTGGWLWRSASPDLKEWLANAKPGYKMYVTFRAGYKRDFPAGKYYDEAVNEWKIPTKAELSEPFARATIIIK